MLGVLCARHKPWILTSLTLAHTSTAAHYQRRAGSSISLVGCLGGGQRRHHSSACRLGSEAGCASIWHAILPSGGSRFRRLPPFHHDLMKGEGSWNVAWDTRPARWLHRPDSAWLLFGVCACLAAPVEFVDQPPDVAATGDNFEGRDTEYISSTNENSAKYRVTAVKADGRCLFRAVAHVACLRNGEEAPNENHQKELADDLRAQVVDELLRRRKDTEGFIEEDFDAYIKRIEQPYVWGGEPELLMASHVLRTPISVFMVDKSSGGLVKIANYGEEYQKDKETPITILFHGYGHYDILDTISDQNDDIVEV